MVQTFLYTFYFSWMELLKYRLSLNYMLLEINNF